MPVLDPTTPFARHMTGRFDERDFIGVPTAGLGLFGNVANGGRTVISKHSEVVDIDVIRGNEKTAVLVHRKDRSRGLTVQENAEDQRYTAESFEFPLSTELSDITPPMIRKRMAGENPYSKVTSEQRMRGLASDLITEQTKRLVRLCNRLGWQSLVTGTQDAILDTANSDLIYDFYRDAANIFTVPTTWATSATILDDILNGANKVRQNGHMTADMMFFSQTAWDAFINNTTIKELANSRRINMVAVNPDNLVPKHMQHLIDGGMISMGMLDTNAGRKLWMFTYDEGYTSAAGVFTPYITPDKVLILSSRARFDRYFGPSNMFPPDAIKRAWMQSKFGFGQNLPMMPGTIKRGNFVIPVEAFHLDGYGDYTGEAVTIKTQLAPIFSTTMTDTIATLDVNL